MGSSGSKHKLDLIDTTENGSKWKEMIEKLSEGMINFVEKENVSYPWLMICKAEMNATQIEINETIPKYLPSTEKYDWNRADRNQYGGNWNNKGVPSQHRKRVYIKCSADLSKKAFSNFTARYIARIQPNWITGDESAEKGSLCIVVCFNLSRLQDEIDVVLQVTPQDCTTMLVVIQNCREGISPRPMLISNPSDNFNEFTNILYDDGECYDCDINYEARNKVQAFIDNN